MGISFKKIGETFRKVGGSIAREATSLGKTIKTGVDKGVKILKEKALPIISTVAGGIATGLKYGMPIISAIAPEFAPLAMGVATGAAMVKKASDTAQTVIKAKESLEKGVKSVSKFVSPSTFNTVSKAVAPIVAPLSEQIRPVMSIKPFLPIKRLLM